MTCVCVCVRALRKPPVHYNGMRRSCSSYLELLLAKKKKKFLKIPVTVSVYPPFLLHPLCLFSVSLCLSFSLALSLSLSLSFYLRLTHSCIDTSPPRLNSLLPLSDSTSLSRRLPVHCLSFLLHYFSRKELTASQSRLLLAKVFSPPIKNG